MDSQESFAVEARLELVQADVQEIAFTAGDDFAVVVGGADLRHFREGNGDDSVTLASEQSLQGRPTERLLRARRIARHRSGRLESLSHPRESRVKPFATEGLHQIVDGANLERRDRVTFVGSGEDDGGAVGNSLQDLDSGDFGKLHVEKDEVGPDGVDAGDRASTVVRFSHRLEPVRLGDETAKAFSRERLVLHEVNGALHEEASAASSSSFMGTRKETRNRASESASMRKRAVSP